MLLLCYRGYHACQSPGLLLPLLRRQDAQACSSLHSGLVLLQCYHGCACQSVVTVCFLAVVTCCLLPLPPLPLSSLTHRHMHTYTHHHVPRPFAAQFFVKTLKKGETKLLFSMLPAYYKHVASHPHTLLTKFYGLHRLILDNGRKVRAAKALLRS